ncbi:MAG: hypothetical protein DMF89_24505 [Acidobacteria bacterium]|nr:MAG: hypothetical protein DMF89_24505 [Acidobacteriota bacterium]
MWFALLALVGQLSAPAFSVIVLSATSAEARGQLTCTCGDDGGHQCPMHHRATTPNPCSCRSTADPSAGLTLIISQTATMTAAPAVARLMPLTDFAASDFVFVLQSGLHPEAPPPRS